MTQMPLFSRLRRRAAAGFLMVGAAMILGGCMETTSSVSRNFPQDYRQRHPIMVGPQGAYVASTCGLWPHDTGTGDARLDMMNRPHFNHGCASQANLAAMVANPNDLLGPRAEGPIDASRRQTAINRYRAGQSPHTPHENISPLSRIADQVK